MHTSEDFTEEHPLINIATAQRIALDHGTTLQQLDRESAQSGCDYYRGEMIDTASFLGWLGY